MVGDYLFQTDWQARHKRGGLSGDRVALRALVTHVTTYTLAFAPALVWIGGELDAGWALLAAALIFLPHFVIDGLAASVDQSFHVLSLFLVALLVGNV
jgi:hypothetical protein